jgi:hypothetical protein|tara:strand:- start:654 stop:1679 length:1026 start_codon:yes stop_codon:yes gene_type:complete
MEKKLSIGFAHHNDFSGAWFTIQDIRKELLFNGRKDLLDQIEFVVVENDKKSSHSNELKHFLVNTLSKEKSLVYSIMSANGTGIAKNEVVKIANADFVLVLDCHVLLCPVVQTIEKLFKFIEENPETNHIYNGPLVYDDCMNLSTHLSDKWSDSMWGTWSTAMSCSCKNFNFEIRTDGDQGKFHSVATGKEITKCENCGHNFYTDKNEGIIPTMMLNSDEPFEIFAQGTGCFFVRKDAWLGYNQHARGFGGEECYIHEKYRKAGHKAYCLPFLKWLHRFGRPEMPKYPLKNHYKLRNYILEFVELGLDLSPVKQHFSQQSDFDEIVYNSFVREANYLYNRE